MSSESDSWMTRQQLELLGVAKLVNEMDTKEAARLGLMTRPLTTAAIEKHLDDFGLEAEFGTHSLMKVCSLSQQPTCTGMPLLLIWRWSLFSSAAAMLWCTSAPKSHCLWIVGVVFCRQLAQKLTLFKHMQGLSGGQKVKVVLAAAMWNNPHILVMDEPTNFLDRDSLGALAQV